MGLYSLAMLESIWLQLLHLVYENKLNDEREIYLDRLGHTECSVHDDVHVNLERAHKECATRRKQTILPYMCRERSGHLLFSFLTAHFD